ncbi:DUF4382 domain-containing protein [Halovivax gelatinilyticus]|uniref:DUF4382 domain-containing protein n=1 Tax=Halovivax gelatinilyticus TaxID=2961597 RepID=UPI0020CA7200|nr:DUF4382 domain-containing protein [Halovivax gelatinilyticus]
MNRRTFCGTVAGGLALTAGCTGVLDDEESGTVRFYVSDEPNRIDDFEYLHVTVSTVAFKPADNDDEDGDAGDDADDGESEHADDEGGRPDDAGAPDDGADDAETGGDGTAEYGDADGDDADDEDADGVDDEGEGARSRGGWEEYHLDDQTLDLTQLQGDRATMLDELEVPAGEYTAVDLFVDEIDAVLTEELGGDEADVKIPSETLRIRTPFTVEADDEVDFVYDIAPHKAGQSGKYILTPVISQSGTDVDIEAVDARVDAE